MSMFDPIASHSHNPVGVDAFKIVLPRVGPLRGPTLGFATESPGYRHAVAPRHRDSCHFVEFPTRFIRVHSAGHHQSFHEWANSRPALQAKTRRSAASPTIHFGTAAQECLSLGNGGIHRQITPRELKCFEDCDRGKAGRVRDMSVTFSEL